MPDQLLKKIFFHQKANWPLYFILAFFLGLATWRFFAQGLVNWDEAYFMTTVNTFTNVIRAVLTDPAGLFTKHNFFQNLLSGYNNVYTVAKPSYIISAVLINLIWTNEYSTRLLSIFSGTLIIIFFFKILARFQFGARTKFAATFFLAASPLLLIYSRLGLAQIFSAAFFLIAFYYFIRFAEEKKSRDLAILAFSLAVLLMSHYNTIPLVGLLLLITLYLLYRQRQNWKKYALFLISFLALPACWEIITRLGARLAAAKGVLTEENQAQVLSYGQEIIQQFRSGESYTVAAPWRIFYYPQLIFSTEGIVFAGLFLLGLFFVLKNFRRLKYAPLLMIPLLYFIIYSFVPLKFPRNIIVILPALYFFAAFGLARLVKSLAHLLSQRRKNLLLLFFIGLLILLNINQYRNILNLNTNFRAVASFIKNNYSPAQVAIFSNSTPIWRNYLPNYKTETPTTMYQWAATNPDKQALFIDDYFTAIKGGITPAADFTFQPRLAVLTNIFQVKPIILDFIYQTEEQNQKLFAVQQKSEIVVEEIIPLKK